MRVVFENLNKEEKGEIMEKERAMKSKENKSSKNVPVTILIQVLHHVS